MMEIVLALVAIVAVLLVLQRWFWVLAFGIGALASAFALLASIIHFEILGALGFYCLMVVCGPIASAIAQGGEEAGSSAHTA
jgi:hypothetical protein